MPMVPIATFSHLIAHLNLLDIELDRINSAIRNSRDPVSDGLCDRGEYFIGHGFIAIQTYFAFAYPHTGIEKSEALKIPPLIGQGLSLMAAINAGANYWKHQEEWGLKAVVEKDIDALKKQAKDTVLTIEKIVPWADYTCSNLLAALLDDSSRIELSPLLPRVLEWENNILNNHC
jgi:hypothetical protein